MKFGNLDYLLLLWLIPILIGFWVYAFRLRKRLLNQFAETRLLKLLLASGNVSQPVLKAVLLTLVYTLAVIRKNSRGEEDI